MAQRVVDLQRIDSLVLAVLCRHLEPVASGAALRGPDQTRNARLVFATENQAGQRFAFRAESFQSPHPMPGAYPAKATLRPLDDTSKRIRRALAHDLRDVCAGPPELVPGYANDTRRNRPEAPNAKN